jgi:hypothetical protein
MRVVHWIFAACLFTASWDLIFNLNVGGKIRLCTFLMVFVLLAALAKIQQEGRILWPRGGTALMLWLFLQLLFIPVSGVLALAIQFYALLLYIALGIFAVVQIYGLSSWTESIMRIYMASFAFVGFFALIQFFVPVVGGPAILVQQWIIHGRFPRINGFNQEPSYFATYLLMGWIMLVDLRVSRARIASSRFWKWTTYALGGALILCTSKTAWLILLVEAAARIAPPIWGGLRSLGRQTRFGAMVITLPRPTVLLRIAIGVVGGIAVLIIVSHFINLDFFLEGTGLAGTAAHSWDGRNIRAQQTIEVFLQHPFIGRGMTGASIAIGQIYGATVTNLSELHTFWAFPVAMDVLVASGVFGVIPFVMFAWSGTFGAYKLATRYWPEERAKWLRALARGMIFEWLLLMQDQNLMRVYVWFHMTMVAVIAYNLEFGPVPPLAVADHPELAPVDVPATAFTPAPAFASAFNPVAPRTPAL